ncbi:MAG: polyprenyl synthetase family protein [Phycisphaeraceae bacterium]|nr:polyprenyl synthetase family protein [Phycisphaeraceae bacterium]
MSAGDPFSVLPRIERALRSYVERLDVGTQLREAVAYSLLSGGKRLRPVLAWHSCAAAGGDPEDSLPACVALELVHCFSLVHDDLPAMDDDDLRRGLPTLHKHAGEAMAILAGDAMMTLAFEPLTSDAVSPKFETRGELSVRLVRDLVGATTAMISGQVYDTISGTAPGGSPLDRVRVIHKHKTGALIRASCTMGATCAQLSGSGGEEDVGALGRFGDAVGLMFQIVDDLIDLEQPAELVGKRTGKDEGAGKLTYPLAHGGGAEGARKCRDEVATLKASALAELGRFGAKADSLRELVEFLATRTK